MREISQSKLVVINYCIPFDTFIVFSIVTSTFVENREKFLGFGEMAAGSGLLVGPILGGWIYSSFGYFWCYIVLATLVGADMVFTWFFMPNSVNNDADESEEAKNCDHDHKSIQLEEEKVKYSWMIINRRGLFALSSCGILMIFENFKSAFLSVYLEYRGVDIAYHGWIIAISPFFYIFSGNFIGYIIDKAPRRIFMFFAFLLVSFALFMMGPSAMIGFPDELWLLYVGTGLIGLASGFVFIPILPEVIESVYIKKQLVEGDNENIDNIINDKSAALYGLFYAIGAIISPLIGSIIYNHKDPGPEE